MGFLKKAWSIYAKDMMVECRTRERFITMSVFTLVIIIIFNFAFDTGTIEMQRIAPGMMWVTFTFAGMLGVNRSFIPEKEQGSFEGRCWHPWTVGLSTSVNFWVILRSSAWWNCSRCRCLPFF